MVMEQPLKGYLSILFGLSMLYTWHVVGMGRGYLVVNEWMNEWMNVGESCVGMGRGYLVVNEWKNEWMNVGESCLGGEGNWVKYLWE
jgi:hypothetical protein